MAIAAAVCLPAGAASATSRFGPPLVAVANGVSVVPSLAVLTIMLPLMGLGAGPALVALVILACPPLLVNADIAYRGVDPHAIDAARGMGMSDPQVFWLIRTPLAAPVVIAGVRSAAVTVIASATLASFVGGGGLGDFIVSGLANNDTVELLVGALLVAALAVVAEFGLGAVERAAARAAGL